jgi:hypothetical protein
MKRNLWIVAALLVPVVASWATSATVRKDGAGGAYTTIQAAINSGASIITIMDSGTYVEDVTIGTDYGSPDPAASGPPVTLTSTSSGANRPVITPAAGTVFVDSRRGNQQAGFCLFANNSAVSNLIIEALPGSTGGMAIMATNVLVENCLFRIAPGYLGTLGSFSPLLFFAQQGDGSGNVTPNGRDCNGCLVRNCEFIGVAPDAVPVEPTGTGFNDLGATNDNSGGYLLERSGAQGTGQSSGHGRADMYSDGRDVFITYELCYFHYSRDYGIFPSNYGSGAGSINVVLKKCRFDATSKFCIRGRGANVIVEDSVFTRSTQGNNGDDENSAVAINNQDGHNPSGSVKNTLFVNCGSANAQRAYYGGVNNHNSQGLMAVDHCTFVDCLSGVASGHGGGGANLSVTNSIFHQIGDNVVPAVDAIGITMTNGSPELVGGLYPAWTNGLASRFGSYKWSAAFNRFDANTSQIIIDNCVVGSVDTEDSRDWYQAYVTDNTVLGCRLYAGYATNFVVGTVTRPTPVFRNTDPDAPNAFQLAQGSPGQGLGANLAPVLEPKLSFSQAGNQLTISWTQPLWMKGYALKSTSDLNLPHSWNAVAGVSSFGVAYTATVTIGAGNQFFALIKQ